MFLISLGKVEVLSPKLLLTFPRPAKKFIVKENTIGSVVREILYRTKTDSVAAVHCHVCLNRPMHINPQKNLSQMP